MAAYVIADIDVLDPIEYEDYKKLAASTPAIFGGKYIVRGGKIEVAEGEWMPQRFVILEFPSMAQARAWYDSAEYGPAKAIRHRAAKSSVIFVEGTPPS